MAAPMPEPAPVTTAAFPWRSNITGRRKISYFTAKVKAILVSFALQLWLYSAPSGYRGHSRGGVMRRFLLVLLAITLASSLGSGAASAQDFRGGITGRIVDSSGGRMPGVTVTATNVATNVA